MLSPILHNVISTGISHFIVLYGASWMLLFFSLQIEGKTLHLQKDFYLLYCDSLIIMVVWNPKHNIFEV